MKLKAIFLLGTLKHNPTLSHTDALCEYLAKHLKEHDVESEIIRLADYDIKPGVKSRLNEKDDWPEILKKVLQAEIIVFATPIWWGVQSSALQRVIERMDDLNETLLETGVSQLSNKVAGIVITGSEDGTQHVVGNICNFASWNGLTIPPACSLSWLGIPPSNKRSLLKMFNQNPTLSMARVMSSNLAFFANLLKNHNIPIVAKEIKSYTTK